MVHPAALEPKVYYRLTDNWLELTVRFISNTFQIRELKDSLSREILAGFEQAKIEIASTSIDVVGLPSIMLKREKA